MRFCNNCGGALYLFESQDEEICRHCQPKPDQSNIRDSETKPIDGLAEATVTSENGTLMLRSAEGWVLWSGPLNTPVNFGEITDRAYKILAIRRKRTRQGK